MCNHQSIQLHDVKIKEYMKKAKGQVIIGGSKISPFICSDFNLEEFKFLISLRLKAKAIGSKQ